ncbi:uncharacterized protein LOC135223578 [Macrobrachium nipponense]|uniref:uncharacterized protein LOC135223578 n=1 Tax=Macrobrachium nipponense TaxID=159736 RepID=UPI0030C81224
MDNCLELVVQYSEERENKYKEFLEKLKEWKLIRSKTIQGLLDLISYIDSFHKGANVANIVGSGAGVVGAGAVLLAPFTGGLSLAVGGIVASAVGATTSIVASFKDNSVARENCKKAQELIDKDAKATEALTDLVKQYFELTQKLNDCLKGAHGKVKFKSLPPIVAGSQAASKYLLGTQLVASASAFGKGASKAGARAIPVISAVCIAIDVWSIVTTTVDMVEGSKSAAGKELYKVVEQLRKQKQEVGENIVEVIRIQSQNEACEEEIQQEKEKQKPKRRKRTKETAGKEKVASIQMVKNLEDLDLELEEDSESDEEGKSITFCLMNARSVFNKWSEITCYVLERDIDVLAVTETWDRKEPWVTAVPGYQQFFYSPREDRRGGGVGALVKVDIRVQDIKLDFESFECMKCTLTVLFKDGSSDTIHAYILYRSPDSNFDTFLDEFQDLVALSALESKVIIMGDFNIHWENFILTKSVEMRHLLRDHGLHQHVTEETHEDNGTLDWVVTRNMERYLIENLRVDKQIKRFINLDHYPITFTVTLKKPPV